MNRRYFFSKTWQGALFGWVLLVLCGGIFVAPQFVLACLGGEFCSD